MAHPAGHGPLDKTRGLFTALIGWAAANGIVLPLPAPESLMNTLLLSTGVVSIAEMGDKTQLLSLILAARFRKPWPIILGILIATILNHYAAAWLGQWLQD